METITYKEADLLPLTISALILCVNNFTCNAYKVVIDREYPDLKDVVLTDTLDEAAFDLLNTVRTDWFDIVTASIGGLDKTLKSLANIHGLDPKTVVNGERIQNLAMELYDAVIIDDFPDDGEKPRKGDDPAENLEWYAFSVIGLLSCLYYLIINRGYLSSEPWSECWDPMGFIYDTHEDEIHRIDLDLLQQLGRQLQEDYFKLLKIDY